MRAKESQDVPEGSLGDRYWSPDPVTSGPIGHQASLKGFLDMQRLPARQHHQRPTGGRRASGSAHLRSPHCSGRNPGLAFAELENWSHQGLEQPGRDAESRCGVRASSLSPLGATAHSLPGWVPRMESGGPLPHPSCVHPASPGAPAQQSIQLVLPRSRVLNYL